MKCNFSLNIWLKCMYKERPRLHMKCLTLLLYQFSISFVSFPTRKWRLKLKRVSAALSIALSIAFIKFWEILFSYFTPYVWSCLFIEGEKYERNICGYRICRKFHVNENTMCFYRNFWCVSFNFIPPLKIDSIIDNTENVCMYYYILENNIKMML